MIPTIILILIIGVLFFLAIRRIRKKGTCDCSSCESGCANCSAAQKEAVHGTKK